MPLSILFGRPLILKRTKVLKMCTKGKDKGFQWKSYLPSLFVCFVFLIIGVLFVQNEIYQDDWYIEASADGFFGDDNRSLFTLGPNFIVLGVIWLLSLTGIRLFWLHIILVITNFLSHVMLSIILTERLGKWSGAFFTALVGLIVAPMVSFEFQFTTTAAFALASGCAALFDCIDRETSKAKGFAGFILALFGSCLRFDCVAYCGLMYGLLLLQRLLNIRGKNGCHLKKVFKRTIVPFLCLAMTACGLEVCQRVGMEIENPGFVEWNSKRTKIDDYELPKYEGNEAVYEELGLNQNDYNLILSWNYQDPAFFTEEVVEGLAELKKVTGENASTGCELEIALMLKDAIRTMLGSISFWSLLVLGAPILLFGEKEDKSSLVLLLIAEVIFLIYFKAIGRLIWRTEWPIWITSVTVLVGLYRKDAIAPLNKSGTLNTILGCCTVLFVLMLVKPYKAPESMYEIYKNRLLRNDTYLGYLIENADGGNRTYATYDEEAAIYLSNQKSHTVYTLWQKPWLQQYPLYARDTFTFFEVGSGSNFASLGQYFIQLDPVAKNIGGNADSLSFKRLLSPDSLIAVRSDDNLSLLANLSKYLEDHYKVRCTFSVQKKINDVVIGKFVDPEAIDISNVVETNQNFPTVHICNQDDRFIEIDFSTSDLKDCDSAGLFVELLGEDNQYYLATPVEGEQRALIYKETLPPGHYQVKVIECDGNGWTASPSSLMEIE